MDINRKLDTLQCTVGTILELSYKLTQEQRDHIAALIDDLSDIAYELENTPEPPR